MDKVYKEKPSIQYPIGAVLEDEKMIMKVLEFKDEKSGHLYKVEVLQWKVEPPTLVQQYMDMKYPWIFITPYSIPKIKVLE